jgi:hypothetical protein
MPNKTLPTTGSTNWGETLNNFLTQSLDNTNGGGINKFEQFSQRPTNLTTDDKGKTYLYTQTGNFHQWTGTEWKVLNESVINVKDYGAVGDGVSDDTAAIQKCIDNYSSIFIPAGTYLLSNTLGVPTRKKITGESKNNTILLREATPKTNLGKLTSLQGAEDDFNVNAFFALIYPQSEFYNFDTTIKNLTLSAKLTNVVDYGIFAPRAAHTTIQNVTIKNVNYAFYTHDSFMGSIRNIHHINGISLFAMVADNIGAVGGTTMLLENCYFETSGGYFPENKGFDVRSLTYSTFNCCGSDRTNTAYSFVDCFGITLNGCGCEQPFPRKEYTPSIYFLNSKVVLNGFRIVSPISTNYAGETYSILAKDRSNVIFNACYFDKYSTLESTGVNTYSIAAIIDSRVVLNSTTDLLVGKGFGITDTCSIQINDGIDIKKITATGTKTVQFV